MGVTVKALLKTSDFNNFEVLTGRKGLNRIISSVSVMDAPDIHKWLKGGEILMTTGYIMKDDTSKFLDLIKNIKEANAAALFVKIKRFIDELPEEVLNSAEKLDFPVVLMPIHLAFTDVINPVLSKIINEQARKLQLSENIHHSFTNLVLSGGETEQIISTLGTILDRDVAYFDVAFKKRHLSAKTVEFENDILNKAFEYLVTKYKSYPVRIDNRIFGYLIYSDKASKYFTDEYDDIAVEHASTVLKLDIQKKMSNLEMEYRYKNEFVQEKLC